MKGFRVTGLIVAGIILFVGAISVGLIVWGLNSGLIRVIHKKSPP